MPNKPGRCVTCGGVCDGRATTCRECFEARAALAVEKACPGCNRTLPIDEYQWRPNGRGGRKRRNRCRGCDSRYAREHRRQDPQKSQATKRRWEEANPAKHQRSLLRRAARGLGLDPDEVLAHYDAHDGRCDVCNRLPSEVVSRFKRLTIDHCHKTGRFRGLLCSNCNFAIGLAGDDPERLGAMATYLLLAAPTPSHQVV
jgi:hypothetical protein